MLCVVQRSVVLAVGDVRDIVGYCGWMHATFKRLPSFRLMRRVLVFLAMSWLLVQCFVWMVTADK